MFFLFLILINSHLFLKPTVSVAFKNHHPKHKWQSNLLFRDSPTWCYIHFMHSVYTDLKQKPRRNHFWMCASDMSFKMKFDGITFSLASSTIRYTVRKRKHFFFLEMAPTIQCAVVFLMVRVGLITCLYHTSAVMSEPFPAAKLFQQLILILSQYQKTVRMTAVLLL